MIEKKIRLVNFKTESNDFLEKDLAEAPDGFFLEIKVIDVLEKSENDALIDLITSKVRKNGKLIITGIDALELCRKVFYGKVDLKSAAEMYFKHINNMFSVVILKDYFIKKGWDIGFAGITNGRYLIEVSRND